VSERRDQSAQLNSTQLPVVQQEHGMQSVCSVNACLDYRLAQFHAFSMLKFGLPLSVPRPNKPRSKFLYQYGRLCKLDATCLHLYIVARAHTNTNTK